MILSRSSSLMKRAPPSPKTPSLRPGPWQRPRVSRPLPTIRGSRGVVLGGGGGGGGFFGGRTGGEGASDRDNYIKLLGELEGVPFEKRSARFRCAVAFVEPGDGGRGAGGAGGAGG